MPEGCGGVWGVGGKHCNLLSVLSLRDGGRQSRMESIANGDSVVISAPSSHSGSNVGKKKTLNELKP